MAITITPNKDTQVPTSLLKQGLAKVLEQTGRMPPIAIVVTPLNGSAPIYLDRFLDYRFSSSILIPVDSFSFTFAAPDDVPFYDRVKDGDLIQLYANDIPLATGIIDAVSIETDSEYGEKIEIQGRDLMAQFEDQSAVNDKNDPIWGNKLTIGQVFNALKVNTRMRGVELQDGPSGSYLFATEPGETKLSALQRFLEPLNCIMWMAPNGYLNIGRPNMKSANRKGSFTVNREKRTSNATNIKIIYSATAIPNRIIPIWSGQESVQSRVATNQALVNRARGPSRLLALNHRVPKAVVVSTPQGSDPQSLSDVNRFQVAGSNILQAHAKREIARSNHQERIVQITVPGHFSETGEPFMANEVYHITYDRGSIDDDMYLFQVEYTGGLNGQRTSLYFCNLGTIVSDVRAK